MCFFAHGGVSPRIYYVGTLNRINKLALVGTVSCLNTTLPSKLAQDDTLLVCFAVGGIDTRIYYIATDDKTSELTWSEEDG
jgi:hypothetical protein